MINRETLIKLLALKVSKINIAKYLGINRKTLYSFLKNNPISEDEIKKVKIDTILNISEIEIDKLKKPTSTQNSDKVKRDQIKEEVKTNIEPQQTKPLNEMNEEERKIFIEAQLKKANENILK